MVSNPHSESLAGTQKKSNLSRTLLLWWEMKITNQAVLKKGDVFNLEMM